MIIPISHVFKLVEPSQSAVPLIIGSPHSGRHYPDDFGYSCPLSMLRQTEDAFVDDLIIDATKFGATIVQAEFPRSYIDVNRAENDLDPAILSDEWPVKLAPSLRTMQGLGLVRRLCKSGVPMYDKPLTVEAIQHRIEQYYRPYHAAIERAMSQWVDAAGCAWLLDCHSMPSHNGTHRSQRQPDFVLGDRDGNSCDPAFTRKISDILQRMNYHVAINEPYKGMEIMRRYGQPHNGRQALQIEINRDLYMDEHTLVKHEGFATLQNNLARLFQAVAIDIDAALPARQAAE